MRTILDYRINLLNRRKHVEKMPSPGKATPSVRGAAGYIGAV